MKPEEAIKRLRACQENRDNCFVCDYQFSCSIYDLETTAIGALNKQTPMAPQHHHHCPICGEGFITPPFAKEEHKELAFYPRYCYKCGQRIAWSQEAE